MKLLVVQVAALGHAFLTGRNGGDDLAGLRFRPIDPPFPAVTCTAQATFRTAAPPARHGVVANGFFQRELGRPFFWEQSSRLYSGRRVWEALRARGGTVGQIFWQQSLGRDSDVLLSPAPIHKHHGGLVKDCYARPSGLYQDLVARVGRRFSLLSYWGPFASARSTRWIVDATREVLRSPAPDLLLTYLPHLDYELQKSGPGSEKSARSFRTLASELVRLVGAARESGYRIVVFGDYAITEVSEPVFPNRALRTAGLLALRDVGGMLYPDFPASRAFATVDHQVAHVVVPDEADLPVVREALEGLAGVGRVHGRKEQRELGIDHPRSGELVLAAEAGRWFAYPWWEGKREAPDYASHVDIHNKPGYDPAELFLALWPPMHVSTDAAKVKGSHGLVGPGLEGTFATDLDLPGDPSTLEELAGAVRDLLEGGRD